MKTTQPKQTTPPAAAPAPEVPVAEPVKPLPAAALAKPATKAKTYPGWLIKHPGGPYIYELMVSNDGGSVQIVPVTRTEYTQLKFFLARVRNIVDDEVLSVYYTPPAQQT
jgi:hypothetical protein